MSLSLTCPFRLIVATNAEINEQLNIHIYKVLRKLTEALLKHLFPSFTQDYIAVKEKYARYMPHSAGRSEVAPRIVLKSC